MVPGIYAEQSAMCTATGPVHTARLSQVWFLCVLGFCFAFLSIHVLGSLICLYLPNLLCLPGQLIEPFGFWRWCNKLNEPPLSFGCLHTKVG